MSMLAPSRMTVDEFLTWAEGREGRWELIDGIVVSMSPERALHGATVYRVANAFDRSIGTARVGCHFLPDSVVVRIDRHTTFQPDALVYCGDRVADDALEVNNPVIVVEILSPTTATKDLRDKLVGYFRVSSIQHYLIVDADRRVVIHHRRGTGDVIETRIVSEGPLQLDPPAIAIDVAELFAAR